MIVVPNRAARNDIITATQYSGITTITPATTPVGGQVGDRSDAHHLQGIDLLVDPHRAELRGCAGADRGGQRDARGQRRDQANVEERRREPGQRLDPDLGELVVALHRDQRAGGQRQKPDDHDRAADDRQRARAHAHRGDQPHHLGPVVDEAVPDGADSVVT